MTIGFDARAMFIDPYRGFGRFTRNLVEALLEVAPREIRLLLPRGSTPPREWHVPAESVVTLSRPSRGAFLWDPPAWRWTTARRRLDVLHLPCWGVPPGLRIPIVATFHDATPLRFPSPPGRWQRWRLVVAIRSLRRATVVHAVSEHARRELLAHSAVPAERVHVVPHGVGPPFSPGREGHPGRHLLYVGGADPHKNLGVVFRALSLPEAQRLPPLVLIGPTPEGLSEAMRSGLHPVSFRPSCSDAELVDAYRGALALVLPSRNEGFGLPALEAMACGCPVVAARAGALPEVCGDAGELLDPDDPRAWLDALLALLDNPDRRGEMIAAGLTRARTMTWSRAAAEMLGLYRRAIRSLSSRM